MSSSSVMYSSDYASNLKTSVEVVSLRRQVMKIEADMRRDDVNAASKRAARDVARQQKAPKRFVDQNSKAPHPGQRAALRSRRHRLANRA